MRVDREPRVLREARGIVEAEQRKRLIKSLIRSNPYLGFAISFITAIAIVSAFQEQDRSNEIPKTATITGAQPLSITGAEFKKRFPSVFSAGIPNNAILPLTNSTGTPNP